MPKINRPHSIVVKVTADERDAITRLALKEKLTAANWLRSLGMLHVNPPRHVDEPRAGKSDMGNPITEAPPFNASDYAGKVEFNTPGTFKNGDLVATVPKEWGTIQPAADAPGKDLSLPENGYVAHRQTEPKPMPAEQRMYQLIAAKQGQATADVWLRQRRMAKATPLPIEIGTPTIPVHLKPFYDSLVKSQGQAQADFWLVSQMSAKKISL